MSDLELKPINAFWNKTQVLSNISLSVHSGEFLCLSGANGCGKSTLLSVLAGLSLPGLNVCFSDENTSQEIIPSSSDKNTYTDTRKKNYTDTRKKNYTYTRKIFPTDNSFLLLNNLPVSSLKRKDIAKHISFLTQTETSAWNYTVEDIILSGRYSHTKNTGLFSKEDYAIVWNIIELLKINSLAKRNVYSLSGGEFQKVRIARCLAQEPDFLLLDEPVANLDFNYQNELLSLLKDIAHNGYNFTEKANNSNTQTNVSKLPGIIISIHDINTAARFADKLILLSKCKQSEQIDEKSEKDKLTVVNKQTNGQNSLQTIVQNMLTGTVEQLLTPENLYLIYGNKFGIFTHPEYKCPQIYII